MRGVQLDVLVFGMLIIRNYRFKFLMENNSRAELYKLKKRSNSHICKIALQYLITKIEHGGLHKRTQ